MAQPIQLSDLSAETCHRAHFPVRIEMVGSGPTPDHSHSSPANVLVEGWEREKPAAFKRSISGWGWSGGWGSSSGCRNPQAQSKWQELGWVCVPIAVETYGNLGQEAKETFSRLASCLATDSSQPYCRSLWTLKSNLDEGHCKRHSNQSLPANRAAYLRTYV